MKLYVYRSSLFTDVLTVQEHFLLTTDDRKHSNTDKIRRAFGDNYNMFVVPIPASMSSNFWCVWSVYRITNPENFPSIM